MCSSINKQTDENFKKQFNETGITKEEALQAFYDLREQARKNGLQDMTLEEINEEIRLMRQEKKNRK